MPAAAELEQAREHALTIAETMGPLQVGTVSPMIDGQSANKNFLSMHQLTENDINRYLTEATAAETAMDTTFGLDLLPRRELKVVMRQFSTRTAGTMMTAMHQLGGTGELLSGMASSSEAKGESLGDSWEAFMTQAHVIATRTAERYGPAYTAHVITQALHRGHIKRKIPVINLGDGTNEHPTQAMGDLFTIEKEFGGLEDVTITIVGDHARYRAFHSLMIGAFTTRMNVVAVESSASPVPQEYVELLGDRLQRTDDLDDAMRQTNVVYLGRRPDEYTTDDPEEQAKQNLLRESYQKWALTRGRIQQMPKDSIVLDPRPRVAKEGFHPVEIDDDPRARDVQQMANMVPMRMAILATHLGKSIIEHL